ncbi:MAG TPA: SMC-Scp complex subunit ScpB [Balneolaceae bacterium]|nr:SMC-Scp complex subunit ScpB [Balneolales bacterium]HKK43882.1 SMC-Scp complex subunit ScpB [Balneolaceae bacterium]
MDSLSDLFDGVTLHSIVEAMIFASSMPISAEDICRIISETDERLELMPDDIEQIVNELNDEYNSAGRSFDIQFIGGGYTFSTDNRYYKWLQKFQHENVSRKVTPSALEALAIIAYKQPITKPEIDHIRGVDSGYIVRQLMEKELIKVAGRAERPGRPLLYKTNENFLKHFGLNSVEELPKPREINEILQDDDMAEHRQIMLELKAELAQSQNGNGSTNGEED